jgi:hypothetical protein
MKKMNTPIKQTITVTAATKARVAPYLDLLLVIEKGIGDLLGSDIAGRGQFGRINVRSQKLITTKWRIANGTMAALGNQGTVDGSV